MKIKQTLLSIIFLLLTILTYSQEPGKIQYRQLPVEVYRDKMEGGWLGQAIAVMWGYATEGKWQESMVPFDLEDWYRYKPVSKEVSDKSATIKDPRERRNFMLKFYNDKSNMEKYTPDEMSDQDDLYIEFMFLYSILKNGLDVTSEEMARDWVNYLKPERIWGANKAAYLNFQKGIWPPASGHPKNTPWADAIDFQIESDVFGLISPGLPCISNAWADRVGHIMNFGDGVYAGMAMAAMYSDAFFESDPEKLAEYSLKAIPADCGYAKMIRDVLDLHKQYSNWEDAWKALQPKWNFRDGKLVSSLDVKINGAYVYIGLLYGGGDLLKSMNISMRCGKDSDCNPSSVAGILGTILGMKGIPGKWAALRNLPIDNIAIKDIYPDPISWDYILNSTMEVAKWNILQHGGYLDHGVFYIPYQAPVPTPLEQTIWEPGIMKQD